MAQSSAATPTLEGTGVPETFIVDKNGAIINKIIGPQNWMKKEWLDYFDGTIG